MKKTVLAVCAAILAAAAVSALDFTLTNSFGGDDADTSADLLEVDRDGNTAGVKVNDRVQFDFSSEKLDGRIRLDLGGGDNIGVNGKLTDSRGVRLRGYARFRPVSQFGLVAGNSFFTKYSAAGAYLAAEDDTPTIGRIAVDGFAAYFNAYGIKAGANVEAGADFAGLSDEPEKLRLNFGLDWNIAHTVAVGGTAHGVTDGDTIGIGAFASLLSVENLTLNAGYAYQPGDDYIGDTEHRIGVSVGYEFPGLRLALAGDFLTGLNDTTAAGGTNPDGTPYYATVRAVYGVTDAARIAVKANMSGTYGESADFRLYPYAEYSLASFGLLRGGVKLSFDGDGYAGLAVPLLWQYKFANKK